MRAGLHPVSGLSAHPQGDVSRWWLPDAAFALSARACGRCDHLADTVHDMQSGICGPPPLRLALSSDATGSGSGCPVGDPWRLELGAVCGALSPLADGPLSSYLCVRPPQSSHGAHPVWAVAPSIFPGG